MTSARTEDGRLRDQRPAAQNGAQRTEDRAHHDQRWRRECLDGASL